MSQPASTEAQLQAIQDRQAIERLLYTYAEMVDQKDWKRMDEIFALEATLDYTSSGGVAGPFRETLAWLARALDPWPLNLHYVTNAVIDVDGDQATSRCYFHAPMGRANPDGTQFITRNSGRYLDRLVRTADGWRIVERVCDQSIFDGALPEGFEIPA